MAPASEAPKGKAAFKGCLTLLIFIFLLAWIVDHLFSSNKKQDVPVQQTSVPAESASAAASESIKEVTIHSTIIRADVTTADDLFAIVTKSDEIGEAHVHPDFLLPGSLEVVHHYQVDGKEYTIWLNRKVQEGPYVVSMITVH